MPEKPATSIVIACRNGEKTIGRCLDSIIANKPGEIIVVNDCPTDDTPVILESYRKKFSFIKVVTLKKQSGFAVAENRGIEEARGDIIFLTNADCYVPSDWIAQTLKHYANPNVMAVGGPRIDIENGAASVFTLGAGNSSFRKKIVNEVGNMEKGVTAGEDTEFFMRIKHRGYDVLEDKSIVVLHDHQIGFRNMLSKNFRYGIRGGQIARRYPHGKYMSKLFLIPIFWFPFRDILPMLKHICTRIVNNTGKFVGFLRR